MAVPHVELLPDPPLPTDAEDMFDEKAGASLTAQQLMVPQINFSLTWIGEQMTAIGGYATTAVDAASDASASASESDQSKIAAQAAAVAAGSAAGLPSLTGNARRPLTVLPNEAGASWQTQIKALYIEPLVKADATGTYALDVGVSGTFNLSLAGNTTLSFTNLPTLSATESVVVLVRINQGATAYSLTWPAGIVWISSGGAVPAPPTANKTIEYTITFEGSQVFGRKGSGT